MKDKLITKHGDRWWVSRMEGTTMKIFVGEYNTYEEAQIAHKVAVKHAQQKTRWNKKHDAKLKAKINEAIRASKEKKNI